MNKTYFIIAIAAAIAIASCTNRKLSSSLTDDQKDLAQLYDMMSGHFSSEEQAIEDSSFFNINLVMFPIWEKNKEAKWLYVEQAVTEYIDRPYRQRVYRLSKTADNMMESRVFALNNPAKYIHGWDNPDIFNQITPDSLVLRQGCAVYLKKKGNCFTGSTNDKDCVSTLRGATYATSIVTVCEDEVVSWDQGWDSSDEQVWGAVKEGYVFKRKK